LNNWLPEKALVLESARQLESKGLVIGTSGNVSLRFPGPNGRDLLAITPTSRYYDLLTPEDIPIVDLDAKIVEGQLAPSSETMLHIGVYKVRKNVNAVIHTHSLYASAMAVSHLVIPPITDDQMAVLGGEIKVAKYAPSGSDELASMAIEALADRNAVLLRNHGAIGVGKDMREAIWSCELIEKTALIYYLSWTLGKVNHLSPEAIEAGRLLYRKLHEI
jgi:L-fuculose-phosphate aldolase